jgi:hypothetical protein
LKERLSNLSQLLTRRAPNVSSLPNSGDPPVANEIFKRLLDSGLLKRRATAREPARIPVEVQWQPGTPRLPALVRDLSKGGLCLAIAEPPEGTQDARIFAATPKGEVLIPLKVRWSTNVGTGHFVGCQFIQPTDFTVLRKLQPAAQYHFRKVTQAKSALRSEGFD